MRGRRSGSRAVVIECVGDHEGRSMEMCGLYLTVRWRRMADRAGAEGSALIVAFDSVVSGSMNIL